MELMDFLKSKQGMIVMAVIVILLVLLGLYFGGVISF